MKVGSLVSNGMRVEFFRRVLHGAAIVVPLACLSVSPFIAGWPAKRFLIFYFAPIISMAAVWVSLKILSFSEASKTEYVIDSMVFSAAMARFYVGDIIPFSGHMIFFAHTLLTTKQRWYKVVAFLLLIETTYFKLSVWSDFKTWLNGLVLGVASGILVWVIRWTTSRMELSNKSQEGTSKEGEVRK